MKIPEKSDLENEDERYLYEKDTDKLENFIAMNRINKIIELTEKFSSGKRALDVGCAQGNISTLLAERGFDVTALDLNKDFLGYAKKKREFGKISYVHGNALEVSFKGKFDAIILGELIEHVAYPEKLLNRMKRHLTKEGIIIITTPNNHLFLGLLSGNKPELFSKIRDRRNFMKKQFGPAGKDHLFVFNIADLNKLVKDQEFKILDSGYINSIFPLIKNKFSTSLYIVAKK